MKTILAFTLTLGNSNKTKYYGDKNLNPSTKTSWDEYFLILVVPNLSVN